MSASTVVISRRGADRLRAGHPWIYRSDVLSADATPGDVVEVRSERGRPLAHAFWSDRSQISIRVLAGAPAAFDEREWLRARLTAAIAYRASLGIDASAYRLVHAEADRLPGLVVDRYDDVLVIQTLCQATDRRRHDIAAALVDLLKPRGVLARNDPKVRRLEGLDETVEVLAGDVPETVEIREGPIRLLADLRHGQKTGLFLDQRENHRAAAAIGRGRALDAFTYNGGFALHLAGVCETVIALDASASAVAATRGNAERNGVANLEVREANVFDALRELEIEGAAFDTIVLDPPAFAKNRASLDRAVAGYKEINLRALKLLTSGGHLVTCTCSHHVPEAMFVEIVSAAAADAHATVTLVEKRMQGRDHPVLLGVPETSYLKCLVLRKN
ncbi:MAG TPA: class I SAM-dependent rRNA methyltransferase [Vicinamibacterales bacterium]|nr:class I SAM-dependent rRNA methyltransferase [Vicinamibacterales bacterium]